MRALPRFESGGTEGRAGGGVAAGAGGGARGPPSAGWRRRGMAEGLVRLVGNRGREWGDEGGRSVAAGRPAASPDGAAEGGGGRAATAASCQAPADYEVLVARKALKLVKSSKL